MSADLPGLRGGTGRRRHRPPGGRRRRDEDGNVLALVPVAIIVLLGLAALAIDGALLYLAERRVTDLAAAAATDAAGYLDDQTFYAEGRVELDPGAGQARADGLAAALATDRGFDQVTCELAVEGAVASARCGATVRPLLSPFWPGLGSEIRVTAEQRAVATPPAAMSAVGP